MPIDFSITGKTALVTGCRSGIGRAIAIAFAEAGANIIGVSSSLELEQSDLRTEVEANGVRYSPYRCDLGNREELYGFLGRLEKDHDHIDILVNNAGTIRRAPIAEHRDELWDEVLGLNLDAPFILSRELSRAMVERGAGKIIFTASLLSFQGGITVPGYAASKGAIKQLVMALSNELAAKGVQVTGIAPGYIETKATEALRNDPERSAAILGRIPAGRWGRPEDIAGTALFLASPASDYVTGTVLVVDGGWMGR
ncbi:MAG: SDR family oxidoreductase [Spirochaetales bacterium]